MLYRLSYTQEVVNFKHWCRCWYNTFNCKLISQRTALSSPSTKIHNTRETQELKNLNVAPNIPIYNQGGDCKSQIGTCRPGNSGCYIFTEKLRSYLPEVPQSTLSPNWSGWGVPECPFLFSVRAYTLPLISLCLLPTHSPLMREYIISWVSFSSKCERSLILQDKSSCSSKSLLLSKLSNLLKSLC